MFQPTGWLEGGCEFFQLVPDFKFEFMLSQGSISPSCWGAIRLANLSYEGLARFGSFGGFVVMPSFARKKKGILFQYTGTKALGRVASVPPFFVHEPGVVTPAKVTNHTTRALPHRGEESRKRLAGDASSSGCLLS